MAQAATMGPPLSPRETRRSGRRSLPSTSTSISKSPDSDPPPKPKEPSHRPPLPSNNSTGKQKRPKQEDLEETVNDRKNTTTSSTGSTPSIPANATGRTKRKSKDKDKQLISEVVSACDVGDPVENPPAIMPEEEEQGITRCVCGSTGTFIVNDSQFPFSCHNFRKEKTTQTQENSWYNVRLVKCGNMDCVWGSNPKISFTTTTIIAKNANQNCILNYSGIGVFPL